MYRRIIKYKTKRKSRTPFDAIRIIFNSLTKIAASIISLSVFAYLLGWIQAKSYFGKFGASWILSEVSAQFFISYSWIPIVAFLAYIYFGVIDIAESKYNKSKEFRAILKIGAWVVLLLPILNAVIAQFEFHKVQMAISIIYIFATYFYAGIALQYLILQVQNRKFIWGINATTVIYIILIYGFYLGPTQIGSLNAERDLTPELSSLSIVECKESQKYVLHLLFNNDDNFYLVNLKDTTKYPSIYIYKRDEIKSIRRR